MAESQGKDVVFFGKISASMTHEFKNVLAIIKESAGLMEDITKISPLSGEKHQEKFDNALKTIKNQLDRGMELSTTFNRFAHAPDKDVSEINLHDLAGQVVVLSDRFARLKHIALSVSDPPASDRALSVSGNSVWLQMAVHTAIECGLKSLPPESKITLVSMEEKGEKTILLRFAAKDGDAPQTLADAVTKTEAWQELSEMMASAGGAVEWTPQEGGIRLIFA